MSSARTAERYLEAVLQTETATVVANLLTVITDNHPSSVAGTQDSDSHRARALVCLKSAPQDTQ